MKKMGLTFLVIVASVILMSCSSLPKVADETKSVVTGRIVYEFENVHAMYGSFSGTKTDNVSVIFRDSETLKDIEFKCDKNGYFNISKLEPDHLYYFYELKYTTGDSNGISWVTQNYGSDFSFVAYSGCIVNLGQHKIIIEDTLNSHRWIHNNFEDVEQYYIYPLIVNTAWEETDLIRVNPTNDYVEWISR